MGIFFPNLKPNEEKKDAEPLRNKLSGENEINQKNYEEIIKDLQNKLNQHEEKIKTSLDKKNILIVQDESQIRQLNKTIEEIQNREQ